MVTVQTVADDLATTVEKAALEIRNRHRSHLREVRIEVVEGGVILHGRAVSFYGKQVALHEAQNLRLAVLGNRIVVESRTVAN